jgi:hypothetical protein
VRRSRGSNGRPIAIGFMTLAGAVPLPTRAFGQRLAGLDPLIQEVMEVTQRRAISVLEVESKKQGNQGDRSQ